jgi:hypothetical protein
MRSFSLLRTNVGLTTNVKIIIDSKYNLFLESINSNIKLEQTRFKKLQFNKSNYFDELIPFFFKNFPADDAYQIHNNPEFAYTMDSDFATQFDDLYIAGARNILNNKNYSEEFEYFAPLYIFKSKLPKFFIIFRIDGPGIVDLQPSNFKEEFLNKFKTVKMFDLTKKTVLGEWLENNFVTNPNFPLSSLDIDFRNLEFTRWTGINYKSGGYTTKSRFLEDFFEKEKPLFDLEKFIFDGYLETKIINPHILNLSFLFDDTPATSLGLRKWSINRYTGFYLDELELIDELHSYDLPKLKDDVQILENNILHSPSGNPFLTENISVDNLYVEISGKFYKIEEFNEITTNTLTTSSNTNSSRNVRQNFSSNSRVGTVSNEVISTVTVRKFKIISEISLYNNQSLINKNGCTINSSNQIINSVDNTPYDLPDFYKADVNLIEIDGMFHNLIKVDGFITLNTDYAFDFSSSNKFSYWINNKDPKYFKEVNLKISTNSINTFKVYRAKFTDIKDFDTQIVDNDFSRYEYESETPGNISGEPKMYITDFRSRSFPAIFEQFKLRKPTSIDISNSTQLSLDRDRFGNPTNPTSRENNKPQFSIFNIACASDYTANFETFRLDFDNLTNLWSKNPVYSRFGYQNSISKSNTPYLLNNNSIHENFNRNADLFDRTPRRKSRNLDYFYTINSGRTNFSYHSLHIEKNDTYTFSVSTNSVVSAFLQDKTFKFELDKYLNTYTYSVGSVSATYSYDYFSYFFEIPNYYKSGQIKTNVKRYSYFETSDGSVPNTTLFNGMKVSLIEIDNINLDVSGNIEDINLRTSNKFDDYKFSILLSKNFKHVDDNSVVRDLVNWGTFSHFQTDNGNKVAFRTSDHGTPSNILPGQPIFITFAQPFDQQTPIIYKDWQTVSTVGILSGGGYGFTVTSTSAQSFTYSRTGTWEINFKWKKIFEWNVRNFYQEGTVVISDDIIYRVIRNTKEMTKSQMNLEPWELPDFYAYYEYKTPFWKPLDYSEGEWCYREGDFYYRNSSQNGSDFWKPDVAYDQNNQIVIKNGRQYRTATSTNLSKLPSLPSRIIDISDNFGKEWIEIVNPSSTKWNKVRLWDEDISYQPEQFVVFNKILYKSNTNTEVGIEPSSSANWTRIYSFEPDSDIIYSETNNPIIKFNGEYWLCENNPNLTLDNGITIYINQKWKNVLVNISINDNTVNFIQNYERDLLYSDFNSRLTASNFIKQINSLESKSDFIDYLTYIVVDENGAIKKYNYKNNIQNLPFLLTIEFPDELDIDDSNIVFDYSNENLDAIRPSRVLIDGEIQSNAQLDYYSGIPISYRIVNSRSLKPKNTINSIGGTKDKIKSSPVAKVVSKTPNLSNIQTIYRHSGYYMPIFYEIELFKSSDEFDISGNYIFDTSLTLFGIMKQRIISKKNRRGNILKLRSIEGTKSVYPMLDEFGLTYMDQFIFKSSWDLTFHLECRNVTLAQDTSIKNQKINSQILYRKIEEKRN